MIILLDTDVLIDVALDREPFIDPAAALLDALELQPGAAYVAWHSVANFFYLVRPALGGASAKQMVQDLIEFVDIAPASTESMRYATTLNMKDFEDAMQVAAALACRAEVIATRNIKDFSKSPVKAATPADVLSMLTVR